MEYTIACPAFAGRILIVDEMDSLRRATARSLRDFGFDTDEASNGIDALRLLNQKNIYCAILLDCDLRYFSGFQCAEQIRMLECEIGVRTPIIGLSASKDGDIRSLCLRSGMDDYLDKASTSEQLQFTLTKWT